MRLQTVIISGNRPNEGNLKPDAGGYPGREPPLGRRGIDSTRRPIFIYEMLRVGRSCVRIAQGHPGGRVSGGALRLSRGRKLGALHASHAATAAAQKSRRRTGAFGPSGFGRGSGGWMPWSAGLGVLLQAPMPLAGRRGTGLGAPSASEQPRARIQTVRHAGAFASPPMSKSDRRRVG